MQKNVNFTQGCSSPVPAMLLDWKDQISPCIHNLPEVVEGSRPWIINGLMSSSWSFSIPSLKLTANAPENRPKPNRKVVFQPSIFRGELLVSGRVLFDSLYRKSKKNICNNLQSMIFCSTWLCLFRWQFVESKPISKPFDAKLQQFRTCSNGFEMTLSYYSKKTQV